MVIESVTQAMQGMYTRRDQSFEPLVVGGLQCDQVAGVSVDGALHNLPVSSSLRQKIMSHRYVDMKAILGTHELPRGAGERQFMVSENGRISTGRCGEV